MGRCIEIDNLKFVEWRENILKISCFEFLTWGKEIELYLNFETMEWLINKQRMKFKFAESEKS